MIYDRSDCSVMQLLVNETRRADVRGPALAAAHRAVGAQLAPYAACRSGLQPIDIDHVAGPSRGVALGERDAPVVLVLMRAGLFVAEGIWAALPGAALVPWSGDAAELRHLPLASRPLIVVDSVINSGRSIGRALRAALPRQPSWISVAALVANEQGLGSQAAEWPNVDFAIARVSQRSYVGKGTTDTGARLFGTTGWE